VGLLIVFSLSFSLPGLSSLIQRGLHSLDYSSFEPEAYPAAHGFGNQFSLLCAQSLFFISSNISFVLHVFSPTFPPTG